jgi:cellobiose epimerase
MHKFKKQLTQELYSNIIPFWKKLKDETYGGFYGFSDNKGNLNQHFEKGSMLQMRICWFFSRLYVFDNNVEYKELANHAFNYFKKHLVDSDNGIVWATDYQGAVTDHTKHLYYQAFGLFTASQYYESFNDDSAKLIADNLFNYIEENFKDENGYLEQFDLNENRLADLGIKADRTMNSLLHLLEAYTVYLKVTKNETVKKALIKLLDLFKFNVYNNDKKRLEVLFDHQMISLVDYHSYGHDIEASWLLDLAAKVIGEKDYLESINFISDNLCQSVYEKGLNRNALKTEKLNNDEDDSHIWWVQAEGIVGFYKNAMRTQNKNYQKISYKVMNFIIKHQKNENAGEWYWRLDKDYKPDDQMPLASNWKCPYHNGRMCIELLEELK